MTGELTGETAAQSCEGSEDHLAAWLNLSHELRTPANAILGHLELLLSGSSGPLSSEVRNSLGEIQEAALKLSTQVSAVIKCAEGISAGKVGERTEIQERS